MLNAVCQATILAIAEPSSWYVRIVYIRSVQRSGIAGTAISTKSTIAMVAQIL
jgi:hypothetical protein